MGSPRARVKLLVIGSVHGDETAGRDDRRAPAARAPAARHRALGDRGPEPGRPRGRHAAERERGGPQPQLPLPLAGRTARPSTPTTPAPRPLSEPESRALPRFVERVRPRVTLWYHQALGSSCARRATRRSSGSTRGAPGCRGGACRATTAPPSAGRTTRFPGDTAFVVELPGGRPLAQRREPARRAPRSALARAVAPQPVVGAPDPVRGDAAAARCAPTPAATTASTTSGSGARA